MSASAATLSTARYELTILVNPDQVAARRQRLEQAEAEEQDILAELERLNAANEVPSTPVTASRSELASDLR